MKTDVLCIIFIFCGIFCSGCTLFSEAGDFFRRNDPPPSDPPYAQTRLNVKEEDGKEIDRMTNEFSMVLIRKGMAMTFVSGITVSPDLRKGSPEEKYAITHGKSVFSKLMASRLLFHDPQADTVLFSTVGNSVWKLSLQHKEKRTTLLSAEISVSPKKQNRK